MNTTPPPPRLVPDRPSYVPNQWRVLTREPDEGKQPDTFYVFRNPPNAAFANDERGNRRVFATHDAAQIVADGLNRESMQ